MVNEWVLMLEFLPNKQVFSEVARWGADQELEACCDWLDVQETRSPQWFDLRHDACALVSDLRAARRPKPPSLKEQALEAPTLMERALAGDATAAKQFLHEAGFTDKHGQWLPQYQPIPETTND